MKAKEYQGLYEKLKEERGPALAARQILSAFLDEAEELHISRRAVTTEAYAAILREQSQKWRALARLTGDLREDGFYMAVMTALLNDPVLFYQIRTAGFTR